MNPSFWEGKRVFISGHTGFKGSWLIKILSDFGIHIQNLISKEEISYILNSKKNIKGQQARIGIRQPVDPSIKEQQDLYQFIDNIMLQAADLYINQFSKNENSKSSSELNYRRNTSFTLGEEKFVSLERTESLATEIETLYLSTIGQIDTTDTFTLSDSVKIWDFISGAHNNMVRVNNDSI